MNNDLIKKYLANELSNDERYAFELEIEKDPFLKDAIDGLEELSINDNHWSIDKTESALNQQIDKKINEYPSIKKNISMNIIRYAIAACIVGIIGFSTWRFIFQKNNAFDEQAIYAANFKPLTQPDGIVRGENDSTLENKAIELYEKEDYFGAVKQYEKLVALDPDNIKNNLFLGISLMATNQHKKAIDILSNITFIDEFNFDIKWYLALAYLKNKDISNAQKNLLLLSKEDNYYQNQAKEILEKVDGKMAVKD